MIGHFHAVLDKFYSFELLLLIALSPVVALLTNGRQEDAGGGSMLSLLKCRRGVLRWEMRERRVGFFGGRRFFWGGGFLGGGAVVSPTR